VFTTARAMVIAASATLLTLLVAGCAVDLSAPDTAPTPAPRLSASPQLTVPSPSPVRPPASPPQSPPAPD